MSKFYHSLLDNYFALTQAQIVDESRFIIYIF